MLETGGGRGTGRVALLPLHGIILGAQVLLLLFLFCMCLCHGRENAEAKVGKCIEGERNALLAVRADISGTDKWLSPWDKDDDCCRWEGVGCDDRSGHVVKLDLHPHSDFWPVNYGQSKVNPSLVNLTSLKYLDLSCIYFGGDDHIPSFIGSLVSLEHLNLSQTEFSGPVPPQLGDLWNLHSLDLSGLYSLEVENLHWLSHLSHLQYLDMSQVDLSKATDWLQAINRLPSLSVLSLSECWLPNLPTTLPHVNFTSLSTLDLSWNQFNSTWPLWFFNLSSLTELDLDLDGNNPGLHGLIPDGFGNMKHLKVLSLRNNYFEGAIPRSFWMLSNLQYLRLSLNKGISIPESLGNLSHLESLELELNNITGEIPESLGNLVNLQSLRLSSYDSQGISIPESLGNLSHLESLHLDLSNITGGIPESLGNLINLKYLHLSAGGIISQELLRNMGRLCSLTELSIYGNMAHGVAKVNELMEGLSQCTKGSALEKLDLRDNGFGGHVPDQVGQLYNLNYLDLSGNSISGSIPASIGKLSNLMSLDISSNSLLGVISEAHFTELSRLTDLDMSHNPTLSFNINWSWAPPFNLSTFKMRACHVGPEFPKWLQTQKNLEELDLSSNFISDSLSDDFLTSFPRMSTLNLSHNNIRGILPFSLSSAPFRKIDLSFNQFEASKVHLHPESTLSHLDLSHNYISGPISISTGYFQLGYLDLSRNNINGSIPLSICQIKSLQVLDLSKNSLTGGIPGCWDNFMSLISMKLSHNKLVGTIPSSLGTLPQLTSLHLDKNNLVGVIPPFLKHLTQLVMLDLGENQLSGVIPTWLGESLSSLAVLRLRSNRLYGNIPKSLSQLQSLQILDLACNRLSGDLLLSFHNFTAMITIKKPFESPNYSFATATAPTSSFEESIRIVPKGTELEYTTILPLVTIIDLSNNTLSGHIPEEITGLTGLHFLILSRNHLQGRIPESIGGMHQLESLDLSFNQLSGNIPSSMSTMYSLSHFNVSYNNLFGRIPSGNQLQTFDQFSYNGNPSLCGSPLFRPCPDDVTRQDPTFQQNKELEHEPNMIWLYIGMGTGFAVGLWGFLGALLVMDKKRASYFRFIDYVADELYVMVVVHFARLKLKISSWIQVKSLA